MALMLLSLSFFGQAKLEVTEWKQSFGTVTKGEVVKLNYEIKNNGNSPLLIHDAEVACSCTSVDYPKQPVLPAQTATITVSFDTKSVYERQDRIVYIHSNDPRSPARIRFKGFVSRK